MIVDCLTVTHVGRHRARRMTISVAFLGITNTTTYEIPEASFRASAREPQSDAATAHDGLRAATAHDGQGIAPSVLPRSA